MLRDLDHVMCRRFRRWTDIPSSMAQVQPNPELVLYIWPGRWNLFSIDVQCLAAVIHLQIAIPGKFAIVECADPDLSPSGVWAVHLHLVPGALKTN